MYQLLDNLTLSERGGFFMIASFSYYMLNIFVPPSAASKYSMLLIYPFTVFSFFLAVQNLSSLFHSVCFLIPFYWLKASLPLFYPWLDYYSQNFILSAFLSDLTAIRFLYHCFAFLRSSLIWNKCRRKETSCNELNEIS